MSAEVETVKTDEPKITVELTNMDRLIVVYALGLLSGGLTLRKNELLPLAESDAQSVAKKFGVSFA